MLTRRYITRSRAGHWRMTLVNTETGDKVTGEPRDTKHACLTEWDELHARLEAIARRPLRDENDAA